MGWDRSPIAPGERLGDTPATSNFSQVLSSWEGLDDCVWFGAYDEMMLDEYLKQANVSVKASLKV